VNKSPDKVSAARMPYQCYCSMVHCSIEKLARNACQYDLAVHCSTQQVGGVRVPRAVAHNMEGGKVAIIGRRWLPPVVKHCCRATRQLVNR
jgi:hypothetical protein